MKKNYNYNYINRQTVQKADIEYSSVEVATCTSKVLAKAPIVDGKLWHTTDSDEFYYDWNGKRTKLNLTGDSASLSAEINKIKSDVAKLDPAKVSKAVSDAQAATESANNAASLAEQASATAEAAAAQVSDKVNASDLAAVATSGDYNDLENKPTIPSVDGLASESWVEGKGYLTEHQSLNDYAKKSDIPDVSDFASKSEIPSVDGLASEAWVEGKGYLTTTNQNFPQGWHKSGTMADLIADINADDTAIVGKTYIGTVSFNDLPVSTDDEWKDKRLVQGEMKVDIMASGADGKVILFTLTSTLKPYHWEYESLYGNTGEWVSFLTSDDIAGGATGADGKSAYELAVENGFSGTLSEWLDSLKGADGQNGADGINGQNGQDGQNGADGKDGKDGKDGVDGKSAYDLAVENGFEGTVEEWLASLKGADGQNGTNGINGQDGQNGADGKDGVDGKDGKDGADGKSAYDLAVENGFEGTVEEWLNSLKGADGQNGADGKDGVDGQNGVDGKDGADGKDGVDGKDGIDGINGVDGLDGKDGKSAYELYKDSVATDKEFLIVDHTNFAQARHNELEDYYNNYPTEAAQDGENWPPFTPSAFPWIVVNHAFDGNTVLKLFYKGNEVLSYTPTAEVEREDGTSVARTYAIIGVPSIDPDVFNEFAETVEGTDNLLNANDFEVKLVAAADDLTLEQWLASLKGEKGDGADVEIPTKVSAFENDADYITTEETSARLGMDPDTVLNEYEFIYDENSWNTSFAEGVLKKYYEAYPDEDLVSTTDPSKTAGFNDRIYTGTITGSDDVVSFKATWQEKSQMITNINNPSEVYYIERLDPTSPYYGTADEWRAQYAKFHGSSWVLYSDAALTTPVDDKEFAIETLTFDGFTHTYQAWVANGAKAPWVAIDTTSLAKKIIRFEYEGKDAVYPWSETRFGTGDKIWGIASVPTEWHDNTFLTEDTKDNGKDTWIGEKGVDFGQFDINKFKIMLVSPVKDYVDASIADIDIPEIIEGVFPGGNNIENVNAVEDGLATVQDVINYVRAYFEKKKDELEDSDSDVYVTPHAYINAYTLNGEPTDITMFNEFDLNESGDTVLEVYAPQEYGMWVDSGDIPSFRLTVDIPVGYSTPILYMWNPFTNDYELLDSESQFVTNPRYSSRTINGVTYNSYVRGPEDEQNPRGTTQYKIIITKE